MDLILDRTSNVSNEIDLNLLVIIEYYNIT